MKAFVKDIAKSALSRFGTSRFASENATGKLERNTFIHFRAPT